MDGDISDNTRVQLASADFVIADIPNDEAQYRFLAAVDRCVPEAMKELASITASASAGDDVSTWLTKWGFVDAWAIEHVRNTLEIWRQHPKYAGAFLLTFCGAGSWMPDFEDGPSWNPLLETQPAFEDRVARYIERIKETPAIVKAPEKRSGDEHFEWLALHHVAGWTYDRIHERYSNEDGTPTISTISRAITDTAKLARLTLRPARGR